MRAVRHLILGLGAASLLGGSSALAADMPAPYYEPLPEVVVGGWYLRGYIGMTNQSVDKIDNVLFAAPAVFQFLDSGGFDSSPLFGAGVGYRFNDWIRADVTGEYRGKAAFRALDRYDITGDGIWDGTNDYSASKSEWLFLVNAYVDLGTWYGITPYVGAGLGTSRNTISHFQDVNVPNNAVAYAGESSKWDFAWALHAGVGYEVTPAFTVDLAYRYVSLGDAQTGDLIGYDGSNAIYNPMYFKDIISHDVYLGVRYAFN